MKDDVLEISAHKKTEEAKKEEDYTWREFRYNSFKRTIQLPRSVDRSKEVKATYKNGILRLDLLKMEEAKEKHKRVIEVV